MAVHATGKPLLTASCALTALQVHVQHVACGQPWPHCGGCVKYCQSAMRETGARSGETDQSMQPPGGGGGATRPPSPGGGDGAAEQPPAGNHSNKAS
jgi:hypothetical protein